MSSSAARLLLASPDRRDEIRLTFEAVGLERIYHRSAVKHLPDHRVCVIVHGAFDGVDLEECWVRPSLQDAPYPAPVFAAQIGVRDAAHEPQENEARFGQESRSICPAAPRMLLQVAPPRLFRTDASLDEERVYPVEIGGRLVKLSHYRDVAVAELLAAHPEGNHVGSVRRHVVAVDPA